MGFVIGFQMAGKARVIFFRTAFELQSNDIFWTMPVLTPSFIVHQFATDSIHFYH